MGIILETKTFEVTRLISLLREALLFLLHEKVHFPLWGELNLQIVTAEDTLAEILFPSGFFKSPL